MRRTWPQFTSDVALVVVMLAVAVVLSGQAYLPPRLPPFSVGHDGGWNERHVIVDGHDLTAELRELHRQTHATLARLDGGYGECSRMFESGIAYAYPCRALTFYADAGRFGEWR